MSTIGELKKCIDKMPNDTVCAWDLWQTEDVQSRGKDRGKKITKKQAENILTEMHHRHDANIGYNWDVLDFYIN